MFGLLKSKNILDGQSSLWILQTYAWALQHFDQQEFYQRSRLVQPSNQFFAGKVDSPNGLAGNVFGHCLKYSGLSHWPFKLVPPSEFNPEPAPTLTIAEMIRNSEVEQAPLVVSDNLITLSYHPHQTSKAEDLAANFAHLIAQHAVFQVKQLPPGGPDYITPATEVLAIFFGFGVMFANSAYAYRGGCGSCYNPNANRKATLTEDEVVFALAVYCLLKGIPKKEAISYLKGHLKSRYSLAIKQLQKSPDLKLLVHHQS